MYDVGDEPDVRFTLANERTLLAWLRTALAMIVAGVAVVAISDLAEPGWLVEALSIVAFLGGGTTAVLGYVQWQRVERAMRLGEPLPAGAGAVVVLSTVLAFALIGVAALLVGEG